MALTKRSKLMSYGLIGSHRYSEQLHDYLGWREALDFGDLSFYPLLKNS
ncbi:hypothetical protein [Gallibacterium genomosp. 1]|nr:hypothetical protein [Gallibacterium genomosp. 1]